MLDEETRRANGLEHIHEMYTQLPPRHRVTMWLAWLLILANKRFGKPLHRANLIWRSITHHID